VSPDWLHIVRKAWSVRLMALAAVLTATEVVLPFFAHTVPDGLFAAFSGVAVAGAFVARIVAQKDMK
jgi:hypothetical protein